MGVPNGDNGRGEGYLVDEGREGSEVAVLGGICSAGGGDGLGVSRVDLGSGGVIAEESAHVPPQHPVSDSRMNSSLTRFLSLGPSPLCAPLSELTETDRSRFTTMSPFFEGMLWI